MLNNSSVLHLFKRENTTEELCFAIGSKRPLTEEEIEKLYALIEDSLAPHLTYDRPFLTLGKIVTIGPRKEMETPASSNAVAICREIGLDCVERIEVFRRSEKNAHYDHMTEQVYWELPTSFGIDITPRPVRWIPVQKEGMDALIEENIRRQLGLDQFGLDFLYELALKCGRDLSDVEIYDLCQSMSDHCRHHTFNGKFVIDGTEMPRSLMQIIQEPLRRRPSNCTLTGDNASAILGRPVTVLRPLRVDGPSPLKRDTCTYHFTLKVETHNYPTMVEPFHGAATGAGGRKRDNIAAGRGGMLGMGSLGICTGNYHIPGYPISGEDPSFEYPQRYASPLEIRLRATAGAYDYGNKTGEPVTSGFVRTFGQRMPWGERIEWIKPVLSSGGVGFIDERHLKKGVPEKGMLVIALGGPAYRIGMGGGSGSSVTGGSQGEEIDWNAVQRGNPLPQQNAGRVIRACIERGDDNPIVVIHDQGAGGIGCAVKEAVYPAGARIDLTKVRRGDPTLSTNEVFSAEFQERFVVIIRRDGLGFFQSVCERERASYEILGEITGDGKLVVTDGNDGPPPVNLVLADIFNDPRRKTFPCTTVPRELKPLYIPEALSLRELVKRVLGLPSVGSKKDLVARVDRSVKGLTAQQQCVGPYGIPISDYALMAASHFGFSGVATAIGEQPIAMLVNTPAGARMSVGEMLTNLIGVVSDGLSAVKVSTNWMCPTKKPGEAARVYEAAVSAMNLITALEGAEPISGKDSMSMAAQIAQEIVSSPAMLQVTGIVSVPDIRIKTTPEIKCPDASHLAFIDLARRHCRLGGSALAQALGQIGNECPDVDWYLLKQIYPAMHEIIKRGYIRALHDISDGGLITTLIEMAIAGGSGFSINLDHPNIRARMLAQELGLVIEYDPADSMRIFAVLQEYAVEKTLHVLGKTTKDNVLVVHKGGDEVFSVPTEEAREWFEATADAIERITLPPDLAAQSCKVKHDRPIEYRLTFTPEETPQEWLDDPNKPKVAIIRDVGANGDSEMSSAFELAGFEPHTITITDLLKGNTLEGFQGVALVGGFSHGDVFGSAKGTAAIIRFNEKVRKAFEGFRARPDTFLFGACNGCQLPTLLDLVPGDVEGQKCQVRLKPNKSRQFESGWVVVEIEESTTYMLEGMAGSRLGIWGAHGEGLFDADPDTIDFICRKGLAPIRYVSPAGHPTETYPYNPNGSPRGIAGVCSEDGRLLITMLHPERTFLPWQWQYLPPEFRDLKVSPWMRFFQNIRRRY